MRGRLAACAPALLLALWLPQSGCGLVRPPAAGEAQAQVDVKVSSAEGWKEAVSDAGRFRVMFPREPEPMEGTGGPSEVLGFQLREGGTLWHAVYNDLGYEPPDGSAEVRELYRQSAEGVTSRGDSKLLSHTDVVLNGKLGADLVFEGHGEQSFIRTFLVGRRIYLLQVDYNKKRGGEPPPRKDVERFFDSFTFWE